MATDTMAAPKVVKSTTRALSVTFHLGDEVHVVPVVYNGKTIDSLEGAVHEAVAAIFALSITDGLVDTGGTGATSVIARQTRNADFFARACDSARYFMGLDNTR